MRKICLIDLTYQLPSNRIAIEIFELLASICSVPVNRLKITYDGTINIIEDSAEVVMECFKMPDNVVANMIGCNMIILDTPMRIHLMRLLRFDQTKKIYKRDLFS